MSNISKYWLSREGYTFLECAYIVLDRTPEHKNSEHSHEVLSAMRDIQTTIKNKVPSIYDSVLAEEKGVSKLWLIAIAEFYGITDFFKDDPLRARAITDILGANPPSLNNQIAPTKLPPYLDPSSSIYARELDAAIKAHTAILSNNEGNIHDVIGNRVRRWLEDNYPNESEKFYSRVTTVALPKNK